MNLLKPKKSYSVYQFQLDNGTAEYKEQEILKMLDEIQGKIQSTEQFVVSKIVEPTVFENIPSYVVKWKGEEETTVKPRSILLKDIPETLSAHEKENIIEWYRKI